MSRDHKLCGHRRPSRSPPINLSVVLSLGSARRRICLCHKLVQCSNMWKATLLLLLFGVYPRACRSAGCGEGVQQGPASKIVGGRDVGEGEFPWQASLQRKSKLGYFHVCGASLVSPTWLVTAAHCIRLNYTNSYRITIGTNNLSEVTTDEIYSIRMIVVKQGFDPRTFHNDIALVQLFRPAPEFLSPVCLAPHAPKRNASLVVTGWGTTSDGGRPSYYLQAADVLSIPRENCLEYYEDLTESMTCAGFEEGEKDACQGDSGGPLVQWQNGIAYQVGIVSWGEGCAEPRQPGVYTDVPQFVPWIYHYIDPEEE